MIPDEEVEELQNKPQNSSTRLLAVTVTYRVMKMFSRGSTQHEMQQKYRVKAKQLALCITGRKYMGGQD